MNDVVEYVEKLFVGLKPLLALIWTGIAYVLFPDTIFITAACAVGGAMIIDIITKYYALRKPFGSVFKAIKAGRISSDKFFHGTKKKIISFLVLMILCGLSYRVSPISGVAVFLGSFVYSVMFLRECQSILENLIEAGHDDLKWLLPVIKKKQAVILEKEGVTDEDLQEKVEGDNSATI